MEESNKKKKRWDGQIHTRYIIRDFPTSICPYISYIYWYIIITTNIPLVPDKTIMIIAQKSDNTVKSII